MSNVYVVKPIPQRIWEIQIAWNTLICTLSVNKFDDAEKKTVKCHWDLQLWLNFSVPQIPKSQKGKMVAIMYFNHLSIQTLAGYSSETKEFLDCLKRKAKLIETSPEQLSLGIGLPGSPVQLFPGSQVPWFPGSPVNWFSSLWVPQFSSSLVPWLPGCQFLWFSVFCFELFCFASCL